jgi:hypothetical protein
MVDGLQAGRRRLDGDKSDKQDDDMYSAVSVLAQMWFDLGRPSPHRRHRLWCCKTSHNHTTLRSASYFEPWHPSSLGGCQIPLLFSRKIFSCVPSARPYGPRDPAVRGRRQRDAAPTCKSLVSVTWRNGRRVRKSLALMRSLQGHWSATRPACSVGPHGLASVSKRSGALRVLLCPLQLASSEAG